MNKLKMHSPNLTEGNISKLVALFPNCVTESHDEKGELKRSIDFDQLRQELSSAIVEGPQERYHLNWPGKREALLTANAPIAKTLRPCREESVDFDTTQNLFIEGDNLDVLKLLQETYLGKVNTICIDPPYNTGKDFIYSDNFNIDKAEYEQESGQRDEEGGRLVANLESNGRFHSDWLSMMYPRLKLARNLLKDDGMIFISIDDGEVASLRKICDEIFGEENFFAQMVWKNKTGGGAKTKGWIGLHEYILCFAKNSLAVRDISIPYSEKTASMYNKKDEKYDIRGPYATWPLDTTSMGDRPNLKFPIFYEGVEIWPQKQWLWSQERVLEAQKDNMLVFNRQTDGFFKVRFKGYLRDENGIMRRGKPLSILEGPYTQEGSKDFQRLLPKAIFPFPKPTKLLATLFSIATDDSKENDSIILDFFAGSCTTAHSVLDLNKEDGGNRKFIMVQLPEKCDEKSEAYKAGYSTIAEIGKERIRQAGKKITTEYIENAEKRKEDLFDSSSVSSVVPKLDIGFRVLKIDSSNMADVYYTPDAIDQPQIKLFTDNIKPDRTAEDLLFQVLLDWGVDLSLPVTKEIIADKDVFFVDGNALAACFVKNGGITEDFVKELAKRKPLRVVFRDAGFKDDSVKINVEQIFKLMSPHTEVKTI